MKQLNSFVVLCYFRFFILINLFLKFFFVIIFLRKQRNVENHANNGIELDVGHDVGFTLVPYRTNAVKTEHAGGRETYMVMAVVVVGAVEEGARCE